MGRPLKVLIVDDEPAIVHALEILMDVHGFPCVTADSPEAAMAAIDQGDIGVAIQDMNFRTNETSGEDGLALFRQIHKRDPELPVLLITAWASLESAVQLIKEGAADYLSKPWDDRKLVNSVRNLLRLRRLQLENEALLEQGRQDRADLRERFDLCGLIYRSAEMHRVVNMAINVAPSDAPVLITGPSGAGKEKLAEIVQANSARKDGPFVKVNVGALPAELMEAELFGAEAGAFTGSTGLRVGRFEAADGGTLFLDEIDSLPPAGQVKLLRVLQTGEYQRLGSSRTRKANVRVVSATNSDLQRSITEGRFREDLYFRVNVIELQLPPLRERPEDVVALAQHFLNPAGEPEKVLRREAEVALARYPWPGNVRELQNRMQRVRLTCPGESVGVAELELPEVDESAMDTPPVAPSAAGHAVATGPIAAEKQKVEEALRNAGGVVSRAADALGLSRQALYRRMDRLGITLEKRLRS